MNLGRTPGEARPNPGFCALFHLNNVKSFVSGSVSGRIKVLAGDEVYDATKQRTKEINDIAKQSTTITIESAKRFGSKAKITKVKKLSIYKFY